MNEVYEYRANVFSAHAGVEFPMEPVWVEDEEQARQRCQAVLDRVYGRKGYFIVNFEVETVPQNMQNDLRRYQQVLDRLQEIHDEFQERNRMPDHEAFTASEMMKTRVLLDEQIKLFLERDILSNRLHELWALNKAQSN